MRVLRFLALAYKMGLESYVARYVCWPHRLTTRKGFMTILFILFTAVFVLGSLGYPKRLTAAMDGFLSRDMTASINGYFIALVFLSHLRPYIDDASYALTDQGFLWAIKHLSQLIVTTFLFFSGYGIMESIKAKGETYVRDLPMRRILPFLLDVWLALPFFVMVRILLGKRLPSLSTYLQSMVGWTSIGNSNWYIFAILCLWIATYLAFMAFPRKEQRQYAVLVTVGLTFVYYAVLYKVGRPQRFYDTVLCFPAGMLLSLERERVIAAARRVRHPRIVWAASLVILVVLFAGLHHIARKSAMLFNAQSIVFVLLVALCSLAATSISKPFVWAGHNLFLLFIYQRIPMILLQPLAKRSTLIYAIACLASLIPFCLVMSRVHAWWRGIFLERQKGRT